MNLYSISDKIVFKILQEIKNGDRNWRSGQTQSDINLVTSRTVPIQPPRDQRIVVFHQKT